MKNNILIVDDEPDIIKVLTARLQSHGFDVLSALSGQEALLKVKQAKPDLIILDVIMPDMSGNEVAEKLKESKSAAGIPIIFLSALQTKKDERMDGDLIGKNVILAKPYDIDALISKIKSLI